MNTTSASSAHASKPSSAADYAAAEDALAARLAPTVDEAAFDSDEDRFGPQDADLEQEDETAEILADAAPEQLLDLLASPELRDRAALEFAYRAGIPVLAPIDPADLNRNGQSARYLAQPLANYAVRLAEHRIDYTSSAPRTGKRAGGFNRCTCGKVARNANGNGIHKSAADKRASKLYDEEATAARKLLHYKAAARRPVYCDETSSEERTWAAMD